MQDPREKFELFPSLGYYFVAFRTIESKKTRERRRLRMYGQEGKQIGVLEEGIVGIVNVYLVVFREGICSVCSLQFMLSFDTHSFDLVPLR